MKNKKIVSVIFIYYSLFVFLVLVKISKYNFNLSSMINIWKGFDILNPEYFEKNFLLFDLQGYDGQFFFLISKYIYNFNLLETPVLDSFSLRFSRISMPLIVGFFCNLFSFEFYSLICLTFLNILHIMSVYFFYIEKKDFLKTSLLIFSPYTLTSNFLLVTDGFLASSVIIFYLLDERRSKSFFLGLFYLVFSILVIFSKEIGFFIIGYFFLKNAFLNDSRKMNFLFFSMLLFLGFKISLKYFYFNGISTNELSFLQLSDFPFFGFFKSFSLTDFSLKQIPKIVLKISLFFSIFLYFDFKSKLKLENILNHFLLLIVIISEEGYWYNLDNALRFFTIIYVWYILTEKEIKLNFLKVQILIIFLVILKIGNIKFATFLLK